jgi:hypothetical protein
MEGLKPSIRFRYNLKLEIIENQHFIIPQSEIADSEIPLSQSSLKLDMTVRWPWTNWILMYMSRSPH